jgi:hypothetical protein
MSDPLAPQEAIPAELLVLRTIARHAEPAAPMSAASMRVLLRHIAWLEGQIMSQRRLIEQRPAVVVPMHPPA